MEILLYTTHCPKCNMIENILTKKNITFQKEENLETILKVAGENNISSAPFAKIDGIIYNTKQLQEFIKSV